VERKKACRFTKREGNQAVPVAELTAFGRKSGRSPKTRRTLLVRKKKMIWKGRGKRRVILAVEEYNRKKSLKGFSISEKKRNDVSVGTTLQLGRWKRGRRPRGSNGVPLRSWRKRGKDARRRGEGERPTVSEKGRRGEGGGPQRTPFSLYR